MTSEGHVYLATAAQLPHGDPDTARLAAYLRDCGFSVEIMVWDDPQIDWSRSDITVIRSTWDYHTRRADFVRWCRSTPRLWNPAPLVQWNTDKRYLLDLAERLPVVTSHLLIDPSAETVLEALEELGWDEGVLKPTVGLDGHGVTRVSRSHRSAAPRLGAWLLQPLIPEAMSDGETSIVVIDGTPTHAVLRRPPPDDFRAQERLGGGVEAVVAADDLLELAARAVSNVHPQPLYARVDLVRNESRPVLMELELVEPSLFFEHATPALAAMSEAIQRRLVR